MRSWGSGALTLPLGHQALLPELLEPPLLGCRRRCPPARAAPTALVERGKQFQPKGRGDECFQQFPKNSTRLFKLCPSSAPAWFLLPGQLSSVVSSGPTKNRHIERNYCPDRRTRLFSEKK